MKNAAQAYFQTKVSTTDQGQLLLMLYDGALNFLQQARDKMIARDYAAKGMLISKAIDIVNELSNTLNLEKGGTLAENLNNLYFLCTARLLQANLKMNLDQLDSVVGILSGLRSAYAQIIETPEAQKAGAQIAARMKPDASMSQRAAPIMAPPVMAGGVMGQVQARAAYGQQQNHGLAPQAVPAPAPVAVETSVTAFQAPVSPLASPSSVAPAPQQAQALTPSLGGLSKRMAGYGKFAQGA
ncbi:MAG: flagellar export chaperone FliS [Desulfovibrionaceae bacterium]